MTNKSIHGRFIRRWAIRFKPFCDSKISPTWRKSDVRDFIRQAALVSADSWLNLEAERYAAKEWKIMDKPYWTPEFHDWYKTREDDFLLKAKASSCQLSIDEIDDLIAEELSYWGES